MANLKREINKDQAKADEIKSLKARVKSQGKLLDQYEKQIEEVRKAKYKLPKSRKARSSKADYVRVVIPDTHGCYADKEAMRAFLDDVKHLKPKEVVLLGDHLDCGGFLAQHHTMGYVSEATYSYEMDCMATNSFLDELQELCPGADFHYLEGNHERRIEKYCITSAVRSGAPNIQREAEHLRQLYAVENVLSLDKRKIQLYRQGQFYHDLGIPATIKLGRCHFTHGCSTSVNCAKVHVERFNANVCYGHSHRADSYMIRTVSQGVIGAWNPGCLCVLQPLYLHQNVSNWSHGYGLQLVTSSGDFLHINVPIIDGKSYFVSVAERLS
tara:strand:- start:545 stop:1525 length:981 start_codon:yes stop_codon:yes gene_type:complete